MAKSAKRGGKRPAKATITARKEGSGGFRWKYVFFAACGGALLAAAYGFYSSQNRAASFEELAQSGQAALSRVEVAPSEGRAHVPVGQPLQYATDPPTSGSHYPVWVDPGFYESAQSRVNLVHSLEHGMIVIYYDTPGDTVLDRLRDWAGLFNGPWSGIVAVPRAGLGEKLILTAWRRTLRLDRFEEKSAAAFIDAFRGRGPENPVR
ncbi:MAG: DUF3105 domain-containing protein [Alphaproteobacteria bacterium]